MEFQATRSQALAFTLTDDENSPLRMAASTEDNSIAKEMADVGLPDDLQMADSIDSVMNRSHSAPPILVSRPSLLLVVLIECHV